MTSKKEKVFEIFDEIIDSDKTGDLTLKQYIIREDQALRQRCFRAFGSVSKALEEYGMTDEKPSTELSFERLYDFIGHTFEVKEDGRVIIDFETFLRKITELQAMGYNVDSKRTIREIESFLAMDRIEAFMRLYNENANAILDMRKGRRYPENQIITLVEKHYPDRTALYRTYRVNRYLLNGGKNFVRIRSLMDLGHDFELLVEEVLTEVFGDIQVKPVIEGNIPDFVFGGTWFDAKLSRSTSLAPGCRTIQKYRRHTDKLTIIYALHDTDHSDSRATFVHISEYYPLISTHLQRKIDAFIRKASEVRFGGNRRQAHI